MQDKPMPDDMHRYVGAGTVNGKPQQRVFVAQEPLLAGGEQRFTMQAEPNRDWPGRSGRTMSKRRDIGCSGSSKPGPVRLRMTVRAKQDAFRDLDPDLAFAAVRQGTKIQGEQFLTRIEMMPTQRGKVAVVPACAAFRSSLRDQSALSFHPSRLLAQVALMSMIRVRVLAGAAAEPSLPARKG